MRVIVPYAVLYPETRAALEADGVAAEYCFTGRTPTDYYDLLARVWAEGATFANVEQDIVVWPGALAKLEECPEPWCGYAYTLSTGYGAYLGCTRFRAELIAALPDLFNTVAQLPQHGTPARYWGRLDTRIKEVLEDRGGYQMHVHWPVVGHLNPAQQFAGAFHCPHGKAIPRAVMEAQPWPYPCDCP